MRNTAITLLRRLGFDNIAAATRHYIDELPQGHLASPLWEN
jgi:hypothetical protein